MYVIKRDGQIKPYKRDNIKQAVKKAFKRCFKI